MSAMFAHGTQTSFEQQAEEVISNCAKHGINNLFVQVRPFCDSLYPSKLFGWSRFALSKDKKAPDYDPLEILTALAHAENIKIHAWINPYRVSYSTDYSELDGDCPALKKEYKPHTFVTKDGIYFNPSSLQAQGLVLNGIREILKNYDVDGIHIDDYFYPMPDGDFDSEEYENYTNSGGTLSLEDWRRENVNALVAGMYAIVKVSGNRVFSISPAGDIDKNYTDMYADVSHWFTSEGYADMIIPQIYFGFEHEKLPFDATLSRWKELANGSRVQLVCGLAAYKQGKEDAFAGIGRAEWQTNADLLEIQMKQALTDETCSGYVLFSYGYAF